MVIGVFSLTVVNVSLLSSSIITSELAGSVELVLSRTNNAVGPVSVLVTTVDGTAQSNLLQLYSQSYP